MKICSVVGWIASALALSACTNKAETAAPAAKAPSLRAAISDAAAAAISDAAAPVLASSQDLTRFIPDRLAEFVQVGDVEASTPSVVGMEVSKAVCKYEANGKTLFITITDAIGADVMREPFAMASTLHQEGTGGFQKGKRIGAHPAIVVWDAQIKRNEVTLLVGRRYVVKVDVRKATSDDEAEKLAVMLDIDRLAKLKPGAD